MVAMNALVIQAEGDDCSGKSNGGDNKSVGSSDSDKDSDSFKVKMMDL